MAFADLNAKPEEQHVAVPDDVVAAFDAVVAGLACVADRALLDQVLPVDRLGLDEPALEVGVALAPSGLAPRSLAAADRPGADLPCR